MRKLVLLALVGCGPVDAQLHQSAGSISYLAQSAILPNTLRANVFQRCALSLVAGLAKEGWDSTHGGNVEARDVGNTVLGCIVTDLIVQNFR